MNIFTGSPKRNFKKIAILVCCTFLLQVFWANILFAQCPTKADFSSLGQCHSTCDYISVNLFNRNNAAATAQTDGILFNLNIQQENNRFIPVALSEFTAYPIENRDVALTFTTASKLNNAGFSVERKTAADADFTEIAFVEGEGATAEKTHYVYRDYNAPTGVLYYRLKQTDFDGKIDYSSVKKVEIKGGISAVDFKISPNPAAAGATLDLAGQDIDTVTLHDSRGKRLHRISAGDGSVNDYEVPQIAAGTYYLHLTIAGKSVHKLLIVR